MELRTQQSTLLRQAPWIVGCRAIGILATVAANILVARLLGPVEFGRYLFLFSVAVCGSLIGAAGLSDAVLRFSSESLAHGHHGLAVAYVRRIVRLCIASTLIAAGLAAMALFAFQTATGRLSEPVLLAALTILALVTLTWQQLASETLRGWNHLKLASLFSGGTTGGPISTLLFLIGMIALFLAQVPMTAAGVLALLGASVSLTVPFALCSVWKMVHGARARVSEPAVALSSLESRQLLYMAGTVLAINLLAFVGEQLDIWIGKTLLSPDELGVFGVAKRSMLLTAMPVQMAMLTIIAAIPRLHAQSRRDELQDLMRGSAGLAAIPSLMALTLLVLFPEPILQFLFGGSYSGAAPMIRVLAIGQAVLVGVGNPSNLLYLTGHHRSALSVNLLAAFVMAVGGPWVSARFGAVGLAWVSSGTLALQSGLQWWVAHYQLRIWTHVGPVRWPVSDKSAKRNAGSPPQKVRSPSSESRYSTFCAPDDPRVFPSPGDAAAP